MGRQWGGAQQEGSSSWRSSMTSEMKCEVLHEDSSRWESGKVWEKVRLLIETTLALLFCPGVLMMPSVYLLPKDTPP